MSSEKLTMGRNPAGMINDDRRVSEKKREGTWSVPSLIYLIAPEAIATCQNPAERSPCFS